MPRRKRITVLTDAEREQLRAVYRRRYTATTVNPHTRKRWTRTPQERKDRLIEDAVVRFVKMCDRHGVTSADVRHVIKAMMLLDDMVLSHQRGRMQYEFRRAG